MPAWLSIVLWKVVLPDLLLWAQQHGYISLAEELAAKGAVALATEIKSIKTYDQYPGDPPPPAGA